MCLLQAEGQSYSAIVFVLKPKPTEAITEVLNGISPENIIVLGDFNVNWPIDREERPLYNLLVNNKTLETADINIYN